MKLIDKAQETNVYVGERIIHPLLSILILVAAVAWFIYWVKPLFLYTAEEFVNPGRWYDIVAFASVSTASFFVAFVFVRKWSLILFNVAHKPKIESILTKLIKIFSIPFGISMLYLGHGLYVLLAR